MPYKNPEDKKKASKRWRTRKIPEGYGKALYARRAQRYRNEEILRQAVAEAIIMIAADDPKAKVLTHLVDALDRAPEIGPPMDYMPQPHDEKGA